MDGSCRECQPAVAPRRIPAGRTVQLDSRPDRGRDETAARWKLELERRMAARQPAARMDPEALEAAPEKVAPAERAGSETAFHYEMTAANTVRVKRKEDPEPLSRARLVRADRSSAPRAPMPGQRRLRLEGPGQPGPVPVQAEPEATPPVDREILFSRFLCGMIDLSLPVLIGFLFTIAGSWVLNFDYFLSAALEWAGGVSLFFFFFNSFFFLILMGQTPGMYFTELRLVSADGSGPPSLGQVALRILLFPLSALSLLGLAWSLKDPACRTVHDSWSATRVEMLEG